MLLVEGALGLGPGEGVELAGGEEVDVGVDYGDRGRHLGLLVRRGALCVCSLSSLVRGTTQRFYQACSVEETAVSSEKVWEGLARKEWIVVTVSAAWYTNNSNWEVLIEVVVC